LAAGVEVGAVEGVARDDVDVAGEVLFKGLDLGVLARGLAADDGAEPGCYAGHTEVRNGGRGGTASKGSRTGSKLRDDLAYGRCLHAVDNVIAGTGDEVSVAENLHIVLEIKSCLSTGSAAEIRLANRDRTLPENSLTRSSNFSSRSHAMILSSTSPN